MHGPGKGRTGSIAPTELVILVAMAALLTGMGYPMVRDHLAAEARAQALSDLRRLSADLFSYRRDTGAWPTGSKFAHTDGEHAFGEAGMFGSATDGVHLSAYLAVNRNGSPGWQGPYMSISRPDPWGDRYIIVIDGLQSALSPYGWVISAGPDGVFQTGSWNRNLQGDDLGLLLR